MKMLAPILLISALVCGAFGAPHDGGKIVGGKPASEGEIPYIISLRMGSSHGCGGSILNELFVLTAAHCVYGNTNNPSFFTIQYGVIDIKQTKNLVRARRIIMHEDYQPGGEYRNDIAIIELEDKIKMGPNVKPVKLPSTGPGPESNAVLAGWGLPYSGGSVMQFLQIVDIPIHSDAVCSANVPGYNPDYHLCAGDIKGGHGQCNGDSGGPLVSDELQHGVVSWSFKPCSSPNKPGVFTKVAVHREWIRENAGV